ARERPGSDAPASRLPPRRYPGPTPRPRSRACRVERLRSGREQPRGRRAHHSRRHRPGAKAARPARSFGLSWRRRFPPNQPPRTGAGLLEIVAARPCEPLGIEVVYMKFFVDTADVAEIKDLAASGLLDGVTTNPSLIMKAGRPMLDVIKEICAVVPGPVSAETVSTDHKTMAEEGRKLAKIAKNVAGKVPITRDGRKTCRVLGSEGIRVNVTLCFSAARALLAAKADATFISPFIGRIDDNGHDGMGLIAEIMTIYRQYPHFK